MRAVGRLRHQPGRLGSVEHINRSAGQRSAEQHEQPAHVRGREARDPGIERRRVERRQRPRHGGTECRPGKLREFRLSRDPARGDDGPRAIGVDRRGIREEHLVVRRHQQPRAGSFDHGSLLPIRQPNVDREEGRAGGGVRGKDLEPDVPWGQRVRDQLTRPRPTMRRHGHVG